MSNGNGLKASLNWFFGVALVFVVTALPGVLYVLAKVCGIQPESLHGFIEIWLSVSITVASIPVLLIALDVADGNMVMFFDETGQQMIYYGNVIAWIAWFVLIGVGLLLVFVFRDELLGSPDEQDQPPAPFYLRAWRWIKGFSLAVFIMVLPNKDGEIPD